MVVNRKVTGKAMSMTAGILVGTMLAIVITLAGTALLAWMIDAEYLSENGIGYAAMVILVVASAAASISAIILVKRKQLLISLATGGIYLLLLLGLTAFCFGGQYQGIVPTVIIVTGSCLASAMITNQGKGNRTSVRHNRRYG